MGNIFLISDTHFGHTNSWATFKKPDGSPLRPFSSTEEMDETMIQRWNATVSTKDKVYHLGDIAMNKKAFSHILPRLNGTKVLIRGNHDTESLSCYGQYFKDVRGSHLLDNLVLTHIPIHHSCLSRWRGNIHGHLHIHRVTDAQGLVDSRYFCVSVEHIDYTPVPFESINTHFKDLGL